METLINETILHLSWVDYYPSKSEVEATLLEIVEQQSKSVSLSDKIISFEGHISHVERFLYGTDRYDQTLVLIKRNRGH